MAENTFSLAMQGLSFETDIAMGAATRKKRRGAKRSSHAAAQRAQRRAATQSVGDVVATLEEAYDRGTSSDSQKSPNEGEAVGSSLS